ncbi:MAG: bifunctional phosphoglucose/phosphomannose isomerase [Candidatus Nezhaarchaeales archaeon]
MIERHIEAWYDMAIRALKLDIEKLKAPKPSSLVFLGLGGSGIIGDYIKALGYDKLDIPIHVIKEARLPKWIGKESLVIAVSYSGNTLETIEATRDALNKGSMVYIISSNGKLIEYARQKGLPHIKLDEGYAPRAALPLMLYSCLKLLNSLGLCVADDNAIEESIELLKATSQNKVIAEKIALSLAEGGIPSIIADARFEALALRFKNDLNENAKMSAKCEIIPEAMHNDIVGYERGVCPQKALILSADDDHLYTKLIEEFVEKILKKFHIQTLTLNLKGKSMLAKLMYGTHISSLMSIAIAKKHNVNPESTVSISEYKKTLKELLNTS